MSGAILTTNYGSEKDVAQAKKEQNEMRDRLKQRALGRKRFSFDQGTALGGGVRGRSSNAGQSSSILSAPNRMPSLLGDI